MDNYKTHELTAQEIAHALEDGWDAQAVKNGYAVFSSSGYENQIGAPVLLIEQIDCLDLYAGDFDACRQAELDGVKLINDLDGLEKGLYLDTPKNRQACAMWLQAHPEDRVERMMAEDPEHPYWLTYRRHYQR